MYDIVIKCYVKSKLAMDQNHEVMPELVTLMEACNMLKVHPNTLRLWDKNGLLPAIRIGTKRVRRYRKEDIINFLDHKPQ